MDTTGRKEKTVRKQTTGNKIMCDNIVNTEKNQVKCGSTIFRFSDGSTRVMRTTFSDSRGETVYCESCDERNHSGWGS